MVEINSENKVSDVKLEKLKQNLKQEQRKLLIHRLLSSKLTVIGLSIFSFLVLFIVIMPMIRPFYPNKINILSRFEFISSIHLLGTDYLGRDLLSRIIYGGQISMSVGFLVSLASSIIGLIIGLYASYYRSVDSLVMRLNDTLIAFPPIILAIALMAAFGASIHNVIIALTICFAPRIARTTRASALVVREEVYVEAIKALGASTSRIIWLHIAPNTLSPLIVQATFVFAQAIIVEAALSFLGAGVPAPAPSWGSLLSEGKIHMHNAWWMVVFPGFFLTLAVLGLNMFGDGLRDVLDPYKSGAKK